MHGLTGGSWKRNKDRTRATAMKETRGNPAVISCAETYRRCSLPRQLSTLQWVMRRQTAWGAVFSAGPADVQGVPGLFGGGPSAACSAEATSRWWLPVLADPPQGVGGDWCRLTDPGHLRPAGRSGTMEHRVMSAALGARRIDGQNFC
jgi:hypothetical protein